MQKRLASLSSVSILHVNPFHRELTTGAKSAGFRLQNATIRFTRFFQFYENDHGVKCISLFQRNRVGVNPRFSLSFSIYLSLSPISFFPSRSVALTRYVGSVFIGINRDPAIAPGKFALVK